MDEAECILEAEAEARRKLHTEDVRLANLAVKEALLSFEKQKWWETALDNLRFQTYWCTYVLRTWLCWALVFIGFEFKRTYRRLGL